MVLGYIDVQSSRDIASIAKRIATVNNDGTVDCAPTNVQVLCGGKIRTLFTVDEANSVAVFSAGTMQVYVASKGLAKGVLWHGALPKHFTPTEMTWALELVEFLQAVSDIVWVPICRSALSRLPNVVSTGLNRLLRDATHGTANKLPGRTRYYMHHKKGNVLNISDLQRLWRVAFLGAFSNLFGSPEAIWYSGPSPSDLRCLALSGNTVACHEYY